jgi:hypothetical protein
MSDAASRPDQPGPEHPPPASGSHAWIPQAYPRPDGEPVALGQPAGRRGSEDKDWYRLTRAEIRWAVIVGAALTVLGFAVAAVWLNLAPRLPFRVTKVGEAQPMQPEYEVFIGDDGWFFLTTTALGLLAGILAYLPRSARGYLMPIALGVGGILGALITWRTGEAFAPRVTREDLQQVGDIVLYPVVLKAQAALVAEPFVAIVAYVVLAAFAKHDDLDNPAHLDHPDDNAEPTTPAEPADGATGTPPLMAPANPAAPPPPQGLSGA